MFKVIDLPPEGKPQETLDPDLVRPPPAGTFRWIDLVEHDAAALELLRERFDFHPLAIEDYATFELRSKLEEYEDYLFVVLHSFTADPDDPRDIQIHEVHEEHDLMSVFHLKRSLVNMRRVVRSVRDVIGMLSRRRDSRIDERTAAYFRDVYDHIQRCAESIEEARELATNAMDAFQTTISDRTNEVMKRLTVFSAIFLPLGFITGFWGQNFVDLPIGSTVFFFVMLATMVAVPGVLLVWFAKRNWL